MDELAKVRRVIDKQLPGAPHETLLSIDATTGQNGLRQAQDLRRGGRRRRRRPHQARRHRQGRHRPRDRRRARHPGEADRRGREARGPAAVRPRPTSPTRCSAEYGLVVPRERTRLSCRQCSTSSQTASRRRSPTSRSRGQADRGRRRHGDARDPPRAARGRRQLQGRQEPSPRTLKERCLGAEVLESLNPGQQVVKIVNEELDRADGRRPAATSPSPPAGRP